MLGCLRIRKRLDVLGLALLVASVNSATLFSQVVQLPSVGNFSYSGTVSVPDSGMVDMAGNYYGVTGSQNRGAFPRANSSVSGSLTAGGSSINAQVIDLQSMDAAILAQAEANRKAKSGRYAPVPTGDPVVSTLRTEAPPTTNVSPLNKPTARNPFGSELASHRGIPPDYLGGSGAIHDEGEIRYFMERAQRAQAEGRLAAARVYFRIALERMTPAQRERMAERIAKEKELAALPPNGAGSQGKTSPPATQPTSANPSSRSNSVRF